MGSNERAKTMGDAFITPRQKNVAAHRGEYFIIYQFIFSIKFLS